MKVKWPWPFGVQTLQWQSPLSLEVFRQRFWAQVHPAELPMPIRSPAFTGALRDRAVADVWEFSMHRTGRRAGSANTPEVLGVIREAPEGSDLEATFRLAATMRWYFLIWTGMACAFAVMGWLARSPAAVVLPLCMVIAAYLVGASSYRNEVRKLRLALAELTAAPLSDPEQLEEADEDEDEN